jgi:hypothetical protein
MSDAQGMERFFRERGFGQLIGWGDSPALLVIDFTRAFTDPALPPRLEPRPGSGGNCSSARERP